MESYTVIKTINGRRYRYSQRTWREGGRVRTKSVYLGPADGDARRKKGVNGFLQGLVRRSDRVVESEEQIQARIATEDREYAKQDRINDMLTAPTISVDAISEIAEAQSTSATAEASNDAQAGESEAGGEGIGDGGEGSD